MASVIHLDTHIVLWLFDKRLEHLSVTSRSAIEMSDLAVSPMVSLELEYLCEIGRIKVPGAVIVEDLGARIGLRVSSATFADVVFRARSLSWTRDPFDRLIAANALVDGCRLVTADRSILQNLDAAFWE